MDDLEKNKYKEIKKKITEFANKKLNKEYEYLLIKVLDKLSRKHDVPFKTGSINTWACSIIYVVGQANFLFDDSFKPYIAAKKLVKHFRCSQSTVSAKAKYLSKMFNINYGNAQWVIPSMMENNPILWTFKINGTTMDIRDCSYEIQIEAFNRGLIPYMPALKKDEIDSE